MNIALAQLNFHIGNFEGNTAAIRKAIRRARDEGADLVVFPELAVSGYPPLDFLEFADFIARCRAAVESIAAECTGIAAIVGAPSLNPEIKGKDLFNTAYFLADGRIADVVHKALLPTYDVFDEYRYFEPNAKSSCIVCNGHRVALTICEDLWNEEDDPLYGFSPMDTLAREKPALIVNIAASPFDYGHAEKRKAILRRNALKYGLPIVYVNHVGAQTEMLFDGGSLVLDAGGEVVHELAYFTEDFRLVGMHPAGDTVKPAAGAPVPAPMPREERMGRALVMGIRDYFRKMRFGQAVLGLSGGIDSAVTLALAVEALGAANVHPVLMPSAYSSAASVSDAEAMCRTSGIAFETVPIHGLVDAFGAVTAPLFGDWPADITEQNIQARIRAVVLMALANKHGYILLNTSNKSELAVGYGTLYGDLAGGLSVLGDVYKTDVYRLAAWINRERTVIPEAIVRKEPSAELLPGQKDTDDLPPYDLLDAILLRYIEGRNGPDDIVRQGFDTSVVRDILRRVNTSEYKRFQTPPILRVSPKAFGLGRRMPIVARYLS